MSPERLTLSRAKGYKLRPGARKVDRSTPFGNPFRTGIHGNAEACVSRFRDLLTGLVRMYPVPCPAYLEQVEARDRILERLDELRGKDLACWCKPGAPCHADVLIELANAPCKDPERK